MDGLASWLASLWRPHPSVPAGTGQRRARLAAGLLLALMPMLALAFLFPDESDGPMLSGHRLTLGALVGLAASYGFVRRGHVYGGVVLAILTIEVALAISVSNADDHTTALLVLGFFVVPIAMAGILLPVRGAAFIGAVTIGLALSLETSLEGDGLANAPDQHAMTLALQLLAVSSLAVVSAAMMERQARDLEASRELLRQVTDSIPEVMFIVEGDGSRMLYTSPAYETVVGRTVAQAMADPRDWIKAVHPDDLPQVHAGLAANEPELEYRIVHPSTGVRHIRARTFPVRHTDGRVSRIVGIAEDVTASVEAQRRLREAQQQRIRLLQQLAHDMGSPLTPLKLQVRLLQDRVDDRGREGLAILKRNVEHLQRLVEDVGDLARLEGGALRLDRRPLDLSALVRQAAESLAPAAAERGVALTADPDGPLPVEADAGRITQVLYNLVGNALKFTPAGGSITVRVAREDGMARVDVRDTGTGLRPDQLARLFQAFVQVHDPASVKRPEDKGSGLGLNISKGLVEAHGGSIQADSAGPGLGSTFTFRLPLAASP